jgi:hypothetical protein
MYAPLALKKVNHTVLTAEELEDFKRLKKRLGKLEAARPNVLAGFPHFDVIILRLVTSVKDGAGLNTVYDFCQYMARNGLGDTFRERVMPKQGGKKKEGYMKELTWQFRYPLIGHNCAVAMLNMQAAGVKLDPKRGVAWMHYKDKSLDVPPWWHDAWKNFIAQLQTHDNISLSDEADRYKLTGAKVLDAEHASEEQILMEKINNLMRADGLYLFAEKCIVRQAAGTKFGCEFLYENLNDFIRYLNGNRAISKDLMSHMNLFNASHITRLAVPRITLCYDYIELKDAYFNINASDPDQWGQWVLDEKGFVRKFDSEGKVSVLEDDNGSYTVHQAVEKLIRDKKTGQKRLLAFYDPDMTSEAVMKTPETWIKCIQRYCEPEDPIQREQQLKLMQIREQELKVAKREFMIAEMKVKKAVKVKLPSSKKIRGEDPAMGSIEVNPLENIENFDKAEEKLDIAETAYYRAYCWTPLERSDFYECCRLLLFVPAARQKNLFIIGETGSGKSSVLAWLHGFTKASAIAVGIKAATGLFPRQVTALFGGPFATSSLQEDVTRICVINDMQITKARIDDILLFMEHGMIEIKTKHRDHTHGEAMFAKAFSANKPLVIKGQKALTKALRDRCKEFIMSKTVDEAERDKAFESKIRQEKFQIVYHLCTRRYNEKWVKFWMNPKEKKPDKVL